MQKINLRDLYPDIYKTDIFLEVTDEVQAVFLADKRADAAYERQMYRYKVYYSLDHDNGIENAVINRPLTYITNLLYAGVDPKTVQYLAGHENSKTTMDIYAQVKYNKPEELLSVVNTALESSAGD